MYIYIPKYKYEYTYIYIYAPYILTTKCNLYIIYLSIYNFQITYLSSKLQLLIS